MSKEKKESVLKGSAFWGILLFAVLVLVDQLTKAAAEAYFNLDGAKQKIDVIPGWIFFELEHNPGIAYGIGADASPALKIGVIAFTALMMAALTVFYFKLDKNRGFLRTSLVLVVSGGVGNLIDRIYYKVWQPNCPLGVRDMVNLSRFGFAVCNFADFFISIGAVMLVFAFLFFDKVALFPVGEKYKKLAKESAEEEARKAEEKRAKKQNKDGGNS